MRALLLVSLTFFLTKAWAQPSEAAIRKEITNAGTKSIKFTKTTGTRQWNKDIGNWEYVRGVEVIRTTEFPGIDLVVTGDVVYQYTGVGNYSYWKFRTLDNHYLGIPNPTQKEITDFISKDWPKFYGYYYNVITKLWHQPELADKPEWTWHSPNSVEFRMKMKFDYIIRNKGIETLECFWKVRLYRDDPKAPWKNMLALRSEEAEDLKVVGMQNYTSEQIADFEKKTLAFTLAEDMAKNESARLATTITVPDFADAEEMLRFVHNVLRNGDADQLRAVMLQLFAPGFFVEGSKVQLTPVEEQNFARVITAVYKNKVTYKQLYCQYPPYRVEKWGDGRRSVYASSVVNNCNSEITVGQVNIGYVEGVPQTKLRILEYGIYVRQDQDVINYINSFSDKKKLCPND